MQQIVHYTLHFIVPAFVALMISRSKWRKIYLILVLTMLVDLDHLLASPIFDANRCSINFHPLHSYWAIGIYFVMLFSKHTRVVGIGLLLHMITDSLDCMWSAI